MSHAKFQYVPCQKMRNESIGSTACHKHVIASCKICHNSVIKKSWIHYKENGGTLSMYKAIYDFLQLYAYEI